MNTPNKLTVARVAAIPLFIVTLLINPSERRYNIAAAVIFALASATDWLDGYIARKYNLVTNFGKFMDPLADKLLVCSALIAFVDLNLIDSWIVIVIVAREFIVTGFRLVAAERNMLIAAGIWGKAKTAVQMVMIIAVILGMTPLISQSLIWVSLALTVISGVECMYKNRSVLKDAA
ncbi:MAG: CDP-diacylglycerol--glycerol-3-phosphate 3-phosphatidyltransferase [Clostridiales bacterium]|jgi:CDP-diacylglycerol--glycerol-3-phosphate 3-phosphatidyltransferase|nr:CDP-diacylglycerol--glycerol-3-phosphate 3-phosphatidyltransferase [Clostridiales bacterium]